MEKNQLLKCHQGMVVEMLSDSDCTDLSCCGEPMVTLAAKTGDEGKEKHVPVVSKGAKGAKVSVGSVPHPMEKDHYIQFVEVINGDYVNRKYLRPGAAPEAEFYVPIQPGLVVRAYCNKHGLWRA